MSDFYLYKLGRFAAVRNDRIVGESASGGMNVSLVIPQTAQPTYSPKTTQLHSTTTITASKEVAA